MTGTILIVDDEDDIRSVLTEYLEQKGYSVFEADNLSRARGHLKNGLHPDLVILDVVLGDGDGIEFLKEIRSSVSPREVPVIMISANRTTALDRITGLEGGADDYVAKPFDLKELALRIDRLIRPKGRRGRKAASELEEFDVAINTEKTSNLLRVMLARHGDLPEFPEPKPVATAAPSERASRDVQPDSTAPALSFSRVANLFVRLLVEPKFTLPRLPAAEFRMIGYGSLIGTGLLSAIQRGIEAKSMATGFVNALMIPAACAAATAAVAWLIQWIMGLRKKPVKVKDVFVGLSVGFAPLFVAAALGIAYVGLAGGRAGDFVAGPLLLFPSQASSKFLGILLRRIDLFEIWGVWLGALALHAKTGGRTKRAIAYAFEFWAILILVVAGIQGYFS